ncbi:M18 family aminopeptidase [Parenemella sanctibonifatiensis]|uniref:M18 family aminopeptidase n=1 Tax=Parenemella sanctibonifatiensis TaxID=2016505 RepID=A0A255EDY5_9ACTN|nr:M18 family aminopeptidase [Parenemella sanctibonifatiensis]OYN87622.1 M18 family aminopeptidase [Parenemella sanctibonifatiensis]
MADARAHVEDLAQFVQAAPTSYHAAREVGERLAKAEFQRLDELTDWPELGAGGYYFIREGAVIAWRIPEGAGGDSSARIIGSHTDSPAFKLKPNPDITAFGWQQAGVEVYGGPIVHTWTDRDLGFAGRLVTREETRLVRTGPIARIPNVAIHLDRSLAEGVQLDRQQHLQPILAVDSPETDVLEMLCDAAEIGQDELLGYDIFTFDTQPPAIIGAEEQFFASTRMDNLSSVHAGLTALLAAEDADDIVVLAAFDHEEVGSGSRSGAAGPILEDALRRIWHSIGAEAHQFPTMISRSSCVSADAGHAINPNHPEKHDPWNQPLLTKGPLLKLNANQRYASDALSAAIWYKACEEAEVETQAFVSRNTIPCGSTIGPITAARLGLQTVDVGVPLLGMHSVRELAGVQDLADLAAVLEAYLLGA